MSKNSSFHLPCGETIYNVSEKLNIGFKFGKKYATTAISVLFQYTVLKNQKKTQSNSSIFFSRFVYNREKNRNYHRI